MKTSASLIHWARLARLAAFGLLAGTALAGAQAAEFNTVLPERSTVAFSYKQMGVAMDGHFRKFGAQLSFDPAKPQAAQASLEVDITSIDAGSADANGEVLGKPWFDAKAFPSARFVAKSIKPAGPGRYEVLGSLSIKGRSIEINAPATFKQDGADGVFDGSFVLKRADFGIGSGPWADFDVVANEVQIKFHLVAASRRKP